MAGAGSSLLVLIHALLLGPLVLLSEDEDQKESEDGENGHGEPPRLLTRIAKAKQSSDTLSADVAFWICRQDRGAIGSGLNSTENEKPELVGRAVCRAQR